MSTSVDSGSSRNGLTHKARWAASGAAVTLAAVTLTGTLPIADAITSSGERAIYTPITPCRLTDTRPDFQVGPRGTPLGAEETITIDARGAEGECTATDLPDDATALALNVTAVGATLPTFVTVWDAGARPNASSLNPTPGQPPTPNAVSTPLSDGGSFEVFNRQGTVDLIIDVVGIYTDHDHDDRYFTEDEIEAAYGVAEPDVIRLPMLGFTSNGPRWSKANYWVHSGGGAECLVAPVPVRPGRTIEAVELTYAAAAGGSQMRIVVFGISREPGPVTSEQGDYEVHLADRLIVPETGPFTTASIRITNDPDDAALEPNGEPDPVVKATRDLQIGVCSEDQTLLASVDVILG